MHALLLVCGVFTGLGLLLLTMRPVDPSTVANFPIMVQAARDVNASSQLGKKKVSKPCATVEQMGGDFSLGWWKESIRVRRIIEDHFALYGTYVQKESYISIIRRYRKGETYNLAP